MKLNYLKLLLLAIIFNSYYIASANNNARTDFRDETIYFVITTRFNDGDNSNNVQCWDGQQYNSGDPAWRGDFKGLIEKLDYIKALGFSAIWITPVVENASGYDYHGYHASNFQKVDSRYLSENVGFQELIEAVHENDMKIILDIVLNHTGNFGEEYLCPMFERDETEDLSSIDCMKLHPESKLDESYFDLSSDNQYQARLAQMKNTDGVNHDTNNHWHHYGNFNWDDITSQWAQIAGDCVDLNTENPLVYNYLIECYSKFIRMGVDGFRVDTGRHISRLVFNKVFNPAFMAVANEMGNPDFFMFAEICTRDRNYWYRNTAAMSTPFYTWDDSSNYSWSDDESQFTSLSCISGTEGFTATTNQASCVSNYNDNSGTDNQPSSTNAFLNGNNYRDTDYSLSSDLHVIDFPMHWNFENASSAFNIAKSGDWSYNDATYNVMYVDSHDYAPDCAPEGQRFSLAQSVWAENLSLMFTFRGIPCLYYGSEIEFKKGCTIDAGATMALKNTGRAYYGGYISGDITTTDFAEYTDATGNMEVSLKHPLSLHIQRLALIRKAIPALRKGQYSTSGCPDGLCYKRRYTDDNTDSYALVAISSGGTFSNILNGTYTEVVTGSTVEVTNNTLSVSLSGTGNIRVYVLHTDKNPALTKIGSDGTYIYGNSSVTISQGSYPDETEPLEEVEPEDPEDIVEPFIVEGEQALFFEKPTTWGNTVYTYVYYVNNGSVEMVTGAWSGSKMDYLGNNFYKYTFDSDIAEIGSTSTWYVLFNDGSGNQTAGDPGFVCYNNWMYDSNGTLYEVTNTTGVSSTTYPTDKIYGISGSINIELNTDKQITIYSIDGAIIFNTYLTKGKHRYNTEPGVYIVNHNKIIVW
ncbi:MAG: alpha-amylase family glycosyl hydrolase [Bacteroidales bacterium]